MVKNKTGGSRHKKQARKNVNIPISTKIRLVKEEGEMYAKVLKTFGGGMADVLCNDGVTRLLIIRRKFKGRNKRDNTIKEGNLLLVGKRLWEVVADSKKQKVDLLYVYSSGQIEQLLKKEKNGAINPNLIPMVSQDESEDVVGFKITSKHDWKETDTLKSIPEKNIKITSNTINSFGNDIDFDDI
jgi:initiation factor 1A